MTITDYEQRLQRCMQSLVPDVPDALVMPVDVAAEPLAEPAPFSKAPGPHRRRWLAPLATAGLVAAAATVTTVLVNLPTKSPSVGPTKSAPAAHSSSPHVPVPAAVPCRADLFTPGRFHAGRGAGGTFDVVVRNTGPTCLLGRPRAVSIDATDGTYHLVMPFVPGSHPVPATLGEGDQVTFRVKMHRIGAGPANPGNAALAISLGAGTRAPVTVRVALGSIGLPTHDEFAPVRMTVAS